jgi:acetolactate synthase I/II/III large subunit
MIGADLMALAVERYGVRTVFGLPGHLEAFFGALDRRGMRLIHMRHESPVITAADAYAYTRRTLGVACVTAGPGLANAIGGIASAYHACSPVLIFAGRNPTAFQDARPQQELDQVRMVRSITKWAQFVHDPKRLAEYIDMAARIALSGEPGPVLLDIPKDITTATVDDAIAAALGPPIRAHAPAPAPVDVERAVALLAKAKSPILVAGRGAYWSHAAPAIERIQRDFGIPVLLYGPARGMLPENDATVFSWPIGNIAARNADVILLAGARVEGSMGYGDAPIFAPATKFVQIYDEAQEIGRNRVIDAPLAGDVRLALEAIADGLAAHRPLWSADFVAEAVAPRLARLETAGRSETGQAHPLRMARELKARVSADALWVGDGANSNNWYKAISRCVVSPGFIDHEPFGTMGVGLPHAIGAAAALQEEGSSRMVCLGTGDGAFGQYLGELATASLHGLPIFVMVANDGFWGSSRVITLRLFNGTTGVALNQSRYDGVAEALECDGQFAATPAEIGPAIDRALAAVRAGKPAVVNVLVDPDSGLDRQDTLLQMVSFKRQGYVM